MSTLELGPILRHVGETTASVWVQTSAPAKVTVLGCTARTFEVQGCHYALVPVQGLTPDSTLEYQVHVDDVLAWPEPDSEFPPSVIRTRGPETADRLRVIFGSCRYPKTGDAKLDDKLGLDALDCYATRLQAMPVDDWPDALLLLGDQVYADELTPEARRHLAGRRSNKISDAEASQGVLAADGDCWPHLVELADRADSEVDGDKGLRFSFRWDLGRSRLIMVDSRNARILDSGDRKMLGDREFRWLEDQVEDGLDSLDHLVIGSSLPWLLPPALGDMQTVNEIAANRDGVRGQLADKVRQTADLEHWPAFLKSFLRLSELIRHAASQADRGPASVSVLSGDVHHSYAARADFTGEPTARVHQLVCSPVHNYVPAFVKPAFRLGWSPRAARITRRWARRHGAPTLPMSWRNLSGPLFGNTIATLNAKGRNADVVFEQPRDDGRLSTVTRIALTD